MFTTCQSPQYANCILKIFLEHVQGEFLRILDPKPVMNGSNCAKDRYTATIFVPNLWQKDNYGQVIE